MCGAKRDEFLKCDGLTLTHAHIRDVLMQSRPTYLQENNITNMYIYIIF